MLLRRWTRALAPGAGRTFGNPGVLLSPELLRDPGVRPAELLSEVSALLSENLFGLKESPATLLLTISVSEFRKLIFSLDFCSTD